MKTLVVVTALALAACASLETSTSGSSTRVAQAPAGAMYCWRDRLQAQADALVCNWESSASDACHATFSTAIPRSAVVSGPEDVKRCDNGQWIVRVTMK